MLTRFRTCWPTLAVALVGLMAMPEGVLAHSRGRRAYASFNVGFSTGHFQSRGHYARGHHAAYGSYYVPALHYYPGWGSYDGYIGTYPSYRVGYDTSGFYAPGYSRSNYRQDESLDAASLERLARELLEEEYRTAPPPEAETKPPADQPVAAAEGATAATEGDTRPTASFQAAVERGDAAFEAGDYVAAREEYVRAIVEAGDDPSVRIALGLADYALGRYADASRAVRWGAARSPKLATSAFDLRRAYGKPEHLDEHRKRLAAFVEAHGDDADALFLLGFVRLFSGERVDGVADLRAYAMMPSHDPAVEPFIEAARGRDADEAD